MTITDAYKALKLLPLFLFIPSAVAAQSAPPRKDIPSIAKAANGAIVTIITAANDKPIAQGTGFLVSADGVIVTNYHVIATGNVAIVKFPDDTAFPVDGVLAADKVRDLAIIKIHGKTFRTLALGDSDDIQVGEEVVAIGNPLSLESTVSNGIISGVRTSKEQRGKFLQTTAPISPGSSGGPLFNMRGEVVGINTMYLEGGENLNFAIPVSDAKRLLATQSSALRSLPNKVEKEPEPPMSKPHPPVSKPEQPVLWLEDVVWIKEGDKFESAFALAPMCDHIKLYRASDDEKAPLQAKRWNVGYYEIQFFSISDATGEKYALFLTPPNGVQTSSSYKSAADAANKACLLVKLDRPPWW
jgi:V8-like Glu-specific endopeptidase